MNTTNERSCIFISDIGPNKNVLTPEGIKLMLQVHQLINKRVSEGITFNNICYRYAFLLKY